MLIKKFLVTFLSCVLLIPCYVSNVYANDTFITLDDTACGFVTVEDDVDFLNMEPAAVAIRSPCRRRDLR